MKIAKILIENILGIESLEIKPQTLCVISGANGAGKSSILEAIKSLLSGGHDPSLIRKGADSGEISITLADGVQISKTIKPEKSVLTVRHPSLGKVSKAQAYVDEIVDSISLNPAAFLDAPEKERLNIFLEALPMQVTAEQLKFLPLGIMKHVDLDRHALEVLGELRAELYDERTGVNRAAKEKRGTVEQMTQQLPPAPEEGNWPEKFGTLKGEFRELQRSHTEEIESIKQGARNAEDNCKRQYQGYVDEVREDLERTLEEWRRKAQLRIDGILAKKEVKLREIAAETEDLLRTENASYEPEAARLTREGGEAKAMVEAETRAKSSREIIAVFETEVSVLEMNSKNLTKSIESIDKLKASLLSDLPIPGLEIAGGKILLNGIPFDRVNTAERYRLAFQVAKLRHGKLSVIVMDGLESLDSAGWEAFRQEALASGYQVIGAKVSDAPDLEVSHAS